MRLTLRTLLAYLDKTLEPQDAETLKGKISESSFATQLVQRIRNSLTTGPLSSPSPEAVGPVEDANVMSEYLDSTLPGEQVAETERACLESEPLLAEAAACHQILTLVVGQRAEVSPDLRDRIYALPESAAAKASSESFASIAIPDAPTIGLDPTFGTNGVAPAASGNERKVVSGPTKAPMTPVGPEDSGVRDAPTRIREAADPANAEATPGTAIAGSRPRSTALSDMYGGMVRPSRITPWLVSLALAGVLLFALSQIFSPLIERRMARRDDDERVNFDDVVVVDDKPPVAGTTPAPVNSPSAPGTVADGTNRDAVPSSPANPNTPSNPIAPVTPQVSDVNTSVPAMTNEQASSGTPEPTGAPEPSAATEPAATQPPATDPAAAPASPPTPARTPEQMPPSSDDLAPVPAVPPAEPAMVKPNLPAGNPAAVVDPAAVDEVAATMTTDRTLVVARPAGQDWRRVHKDGKIAPGTSVLCAPTFRARLSTVDGLKLTLQGPTHVVIAPENDSAALRLERGRLLLQSTSQETPVAIMLGASPIQLTFASPDTIIALTLASTRAAGSDPLVAASHVREATVLVVQGKVEAQSDDQVIELATGDQWDFVGDAAPELSQPATIEAWIDEPDPNATSLDSLARGGLLALLDNPQAIELALREAIPFRRAEVGALASRTLVAMGRSDVYFGGDGILNQASQRAFWDDHYRTLMTEMNHSVDSAELVLEAIARMAAADRIALFELLVGYSQAQLQGGSDAKLVALLDSPVMAVRVLALQNLREITGTTLNYRADQDNAIRRAPEIKKWEVRARKGDIRWSEK